MRLLVVDYIKIALALGLPYLLFRSWSIGELGNRRPVRVLLVLTSMLSLSAVLMPGSFWSDRYSSAAFAQAQVPAAAPTAFAGACPASLSPQNWRTITFKNQCGQNLWVGAQPSTQPVPSSMATAPGEEIAASSSTTWCVPVPCTSCSYWAATNCSGDSCDTGYGRNPPVTLAELQTGGVQTGVSLNVTSSNFRHFTGNGWIQAGSFTLTGTGVDATDDGSGNIVGTGVGAGSTIDYVSGMITLNLTVTLPANVTYAYTYLGDDFVDVSMVSGFNVPIELSPEGNYPNGNEWAAKPQPCVTTSDCDTGFTCSNSQCVLSCTTDENCGPYAATCDNGVCVNLQVGAYQCTSPGCTGANCAPQSSCSWDVLANCPSELLVKVGGTPVGCIDPADQCTADPQPALDCDQTYSISCVGSEDACPSGFTCQSGTCEPSGSAPTVEDLYQESGPAGASCQIASGLYNACFSSADCMPGSKCETKGAAKNTCVDDTSFDCTTRGGDSACAPPGICSTSGRTKGKCISAGQACGDNNACPSPLICNGNNRCVQVPWCGGPLDPTWNEYAEQYAKIFKAACPSAYSHPYDDASSTFHCTQSAIGFSSGTNNTNPVDSLAYQITFCPAGSSPSPTATATPVATPTSTRVVRPTATPTPTATATPTASQTARRTPTPKPTPTATPTATATSRRTPTATATGRKTPTPTPTPTTCPFNAYLSTNPAGTLAFGTIEAGTTEMLPLQTLNGLSETLSLTVQKTNAPGTNQAKYFHINRGAKAGTCTKDPMLGGDGSCNYNITFEPPQNIATSYAALLLIDGTFKEGNMTCKQSTSVTLAGATSAPAVKTNGPSKP